MNVSGSLLWSYTRLGSRYAYEMLYGAFRAMQTMRRFVKTYTPELRKNLHSKLFRSLQVNVSIVLPVFAAYQRLVGCHSRKSLNQTIPPTLCMLIEDFLLDEYKISSSELDRVFEPTPKSTIKNPYLLLAHELFCHHVTSLPPKHQSKARSFLCKLHQSQSLTVNDEASFEYLQDVADQKGIWLPALLFSVNPYMDDHEVTVLQSIGALMKYADDYVDRENDMKQGISNTFSHHVSQQDSKIFLNNYKKYTYTQIEQLSYPSLAKKRFKEEIEFLTHTFVLYMNVKSNIQKRRNRLQEARRQSL